MTAPHTAGGWFDFSDAARGFIPATSTIIKVTVVDLV
jgi:hypothetical protein